MANENKKWTNAAEALGFVREKERLGETNDPLYEEALAVVYANQGTKEAYNAYKKEMEHQDAFEKAEREKEQQRLENEERVLAQAKADAEEKARHDATAANLMTNEEAFQIVVHVMNGGSHPRYEEALLQVQANDATNQAYQALVEQRKKQQEEEEAFRLREAQKLEEQKAQAEARARAAAEAAEEVAKEKEPQKVAVAEQNTKKDASKAEVKAPVDGKEAVSKEEDKTEEKMTPDRALYLLETEGTSHPDYHALLRMVVAHPALFSQYERFLKEKRENARKSKEDVAWVNAVIQNKEDMVRYAKDYYPSNYAVQKKGYVSKIFDRVDLYEANEETGQSVLVDEAKKKDYLNMLFEKSKLEAMTSLLENEAYMKMSDKDKKEKFRSDVDDRFFANVAQVALSSYVPAPTEKELEIGSAEQSAYVKRLSGELQARLSEVVETNKKLSIHADHILVSIIDTADKVDEYCAKLKEKAKLVKNKISAKGAEKLGKAIDYVSDRKARLEDRADKISGGRYKKFAKVFRENKFKMYSNAVATATLALTGYGTIALAAYGAYMVADAWFSPLMNEAAKIKEQRKEANLPPLKRGEPLREAWAKLKHDPKYQRKAITTSVIAGLSFGALAYAAPAMQAAGTLRKGFSLVKMGISNMTQATETGITGVNALRHKGDENARKEFKGAAKSLGLGVAVSGVFLGIREFVNAENIGKLKEWFSGLSSKASSTTEEILSSGGISHTGAENGFPVWWDSEKGSNNGYIWRPEEEVGSTEIGDVDVQPQVKIERFPTEWNKDLGISQKQYNIMMGRLNNGMIADFDAQSLDRAYMNMDDEFMSHFEGKTKMQVFYDYTELARNGRRHQIVLGNAENGFFINTPTGRQAITDEGVIAQAKKALANGEKLLISRLHGRSFLQEQFENVKIDGMTDEKMNKAIEIAMKTYDGNQVSTATAEIHKLFPDLSNTQLKTIHNIVDYNREYEQHGALLDQIGRALGCGEKENLNYEEAAKLLDRRYEILSQSNGPSRPISQNGVDCSKETMLHVRGTPKAPETPVIDDEIVIEDEPFVAPEMDEIPQRKLEVRKYTMPVAKVDPEPAVGRRFIVTTVSDYTHNARGQQTYSDEIVDKWLDSSAKRSR